MLIVRRHRGVLVSRSRGHPCFLTQRARNSTTSICHVWLVVMAPAEGSLVSACTLHSLGPSARRPADLCVSVPREHRRIELVVRHCRHRRSESSARSTPRLCIGMHSEYRHTEHMVGHDRHRRRDLSTRCIAHHRRIDTHGEPKHMELMEAGFDFGHCPWHENEQRRQRPRVASVVS
jgi:hypothetical protein